MEVYEHNGVACSLPQGTRCCGAPWLHSGNVDEFTKAARRNVAALAGEVRAGRDVDRGPAHLCLRGQAGLPPLRQGCRRRLVAAHTVRPGRVPDEAPPRRRRTPSRSHDEFPGRDDGSVPDAVTYHVACHLQAQNAGLQQPRPAQGGRREVHARAALLGHRRDLGLPRARTTTWRARWPPRSAARSRPAGNEVVCGDCHLANGSILQETGMRPVHPMQLMARAYGIRRGGDAVSAAHPLTPGRLLDLRAYERCARSTERR